MIWTEKLIDPDLSWHHGHWLLKLLQFFFSRAIHISDVKDDWRSWFELDEQSPVEQLRKEYFFESKIDTLENFPAQFVQIRPPK